MKKYPICTFKELHVDVQKAAKEFSNLTNWAAWSPVKPIGSVLGTYEIDFGIGEPIFFSISELKQKTPMLLELKLEGFLSAKKTLKVEWSFQFRTIDNLMINTIVLSGPLALAYYTQFTNKFYIVLKTVNRNFNFYLNQCSIPAACCVRT